MRTTGGRLAALVAVAAVPIVVAAARAVNRGWYPLGDNALYALRARDVLTSNHPLIGTWTSASLASGIDLNHPGPLLFDLLAAPARIDALRGVPVGIAALHVAVVIAIAWVAHRRAGAPGVALAMAATSALVWALGSEMVIDPWQPNVMLLPFLLFLLVIWGLWCGDVVLIPVAVGVGSLLVETHVSYALLVPGLLLTGLLGIGVREWVRRRSGGEAIPARRSPWRWIGVGALVGLVLWSQPLVEQVTGPGQGNLARLATARSGQDARAGVLLGARLVAGVEARPPFWLRPSYGETYRVPIPNAHPSVAQASASHLPSTSAALAALAGLAALLAVAARWAHRSRRSDAVRGIGLCVVLLGAVMLSAAIQPFNPVLGLGDHQVAWLWPTGAFLTLAVATTVAASPRWSWRVGVLVTVALAVLALPTHNAQIGPRRYDEAAPTMERLGAQLGTLGRGPYLVETDNLYFGEPYSTATMLELQRRGIDFVVSEEGLVRQLGEGRRYEGAAVGTLHLEIGEAATQAPPAGERRVAFVRGLSDAEVEELADLTRTIERSVERDGLRLSARGRAALAAGDLPVLEASGPFGAADLVKSRELVRIVQSGYLDASHPLMSSLRRWTDLQHRDDALTVGVFLGPLPGPPEDRQ